MRETNFEPREFQTRSMTEIRQAYAQGHTRIVLTAGMGMGKTALGFMLSKSAYLKSGKPAMFVCNRDSLVAQTVKRFREYGFDKIARLQASHFKMEDLDSAEVIVASLQTLTRMDISRLPKISFLMLDEAHSGICSSEKARSIIFHYNETPVVGFTATPFAKGMAKFYSQIEGPLFQTVVQPMKASEALSLGYIVDCDIFAPVEIDMSGVATKVKFGERDYDEGESARRSMLITGDVVNWWIRLCNGQKTIGFTVNVEHAMQVTAAFQDAGVNSEIIHGYMEAKQQQEIIGRYERGETLMLICPCLLGTGFDVPATSCVLWARPTKSRTTWMQYAGRGMRSAPGKEKFTIIDFAGTAQKLGFPTDDIDPVLDDGKPKRAAEDADKVKKDSTKCPQCHTILRSRPFFPCHHCGYTRLEKDLEVREGDLAKLERGKPPKKWKPEKGVDTYRQLKGLAEFNGFKTGFAYHKYVELFGVNPKWEWGTLDSLPCPDALAALVHKMYLNKKRRESYAKKQFG